MIVCDPARNFGWPSIAGTRIGIEHVAGDIAAGQTIEQYAADKELTVEQVQEALDAALARAGEAVPRG